jgi:malonate transporter
VAVLVPLANVLSVAALARHGGKKAGGWRGFVRALATNPLILACVAGQLWGQTGMALPTPVADTLTILARATLALGLLTVGAGLRAFSLSASSRVLVAALLGKLVLSPVLALCVGTALGLGGPTLGACILICGVPTASSAYILARIAGGDAELMAAIITAQTVVAMVSLPFFLVLAGA